LEIRESGDPGAAVAARVALVRGVVLRSAAGDVVGVTPRGLLSGRPAAVEVGGRRCALLGWSRPWPIDEAWWEPTPDGEPRRPRARIQVVPERAAALLLCGVLGDEQGNWIVEGVYE
jgi:protein ImuB